jgi:steroid delta-isomerase-like uncharacterized protein
VPGESTERNKSVALRFAHDVLSGHDLDLMSDLIAADFVEQNPTPGQGPGLDGLRQFLEEMITAFPDLRWDPREMVAEGDRVATWSVWTGTHSGDFFGVPATGRHVSVEAWTMDYFRDGLMVESRIIMDIMGLMQQLGALPTPQPEAT